MNKTKRERINATIVAFLIVACITMLTVAPAYAAEYDDMMNKAVDENVVVDGRMQSYESVLQGFLMEHTHDFDETYTSYGTLNDKTFVRKRICNTCNAIVIDGFYVDADGAFTEYTSTYFPGSRVPTIEGLGH